MESEKKNTVLLIVIAIATLLVAVVGATFAYFASSTQVTNNLSVNATTGKAASFAASGIDSIELNITSAAMQKDTDLYKAAAEDNGTLQIKFVSADANGMSCKYDVLYVWEEGATPVTAENYSGNETVWAYTTPSVELPYTDTATSTEYSKEFTLSVNATVSSDDNNNSSVIYGVSGSDENATYLDAAEKEVNINELTDGDAENSKVVIKDAVIATKDMSDGLTITYNFAAKFYNIPVDQTRFADKLFKGHFEVKANC